MNPDESGRRSNLEKELLVLLQIRYTGDMIPDL
jgi:hypothetical protein